MVVHSGFSLVWRRRNQLLAGYCLPRITDKLIMIGSQFIHMFTTSLDQHTQ